MIGESIKRHEHSGKSSKIFLNPAEILEEIGLRKGERLLDLGCGSGHAAIAAASVAGEDGAVFAVDSDSSAIDSLK
ncbi:MAG: methyltransferase domain-containing protein, partial [Candidatus Aminicenantes bacterium]|nr:methyltransferase domain-containing protein [Candidatus Aminicenantes bacterium]